MTTTYKPKHKRPEGWGGSTPRGPHRWARAAHNAQTRPNSKGAKLYFDRVSNAHTVRKHWYDPGPSEHMGRVYNKRTRAYESKRVYSTCSLFCTAMVVQLDHGVTQYEQLVRFLQELTDIVRPLDTKTLTRDVQCYCCGGTIKAKR